MARYAKSRQAAEIVALQALAWIMGDDRLGPRLLATTGLEVADLRIRASDPGVLAAVLDFLAANEPDLIACADAIGLKPADIAAAHAEICA